MKNSVRNVFQVSRFSYCSSIKENPSTNIYERKPKSYGEARIKPTCVSEQDFPRLGGGTIGERTTSISFSRNFEITSG